MANATATPKATKPAEAPARKVRNPEAVAISQIGDILEGLNPPARRRVLRWANEAYAEQQIVPDQAGPLDAFKPA
jgi:hypothetical protein